MPQTLGRASDVIEIVIRSQNRDLSVPRRVLIWLVAGLFIAVTAVIAIVTSVDVVQLLPMHRILFLRRGSGVVLVEGDAPPLFGSRLVKAMRRDADRWDEANFLAKWSDPSRWHQMIFEPTS